MIQFFYMFMHTHTHTGPLGCTESDMCFTFLQAWSDCHCMKRLKTPEIIHTKKILKASSSKTQIFILVTDSDS